ncbi:hypothetical protein ABMA28_013938 [Loxostege sticticalis]|uniref:Uncharacterized protein n=1 Tax=Loxostege sticticalis TaxID=481309 RepID=A0ABD0TF00_LOXSC
MSIDLLTNDDQEASTSTQPPKDTPTTHNFTMDDLSKLLDIKLENNKKSIIIDLKTTIESEINKAISKLRQEITQHTIILKNDQEKIKNDIHNINQKIKKLELENEELKKQIQEFRKHDHTSNSEKVVDNYKKIVLYGLKEYHQETEYDLHSRIINIFHEILDINITGYLEEVTRIGKFRPRQQRPIVIELISKRCTKYILQNAKQFRNTGLAICEHLDQQSLQTRKKLREGLILARKSGHHAIIRNNALIVNGSVVQTQAATTTNNCNESSKSIEPERDAENTSYATNTSSYNFRH